jgi:sterol desaturase/sphingolipid hydroxylase (fatty acid hydroxylase superfamily)
MNFGFWNRNYRLDKMELKDLWIAYFMHYTIQAYLLLAAISTYLAWKTTSSAPALLIALSIAAALILYPFVWYLLHRYVLHGRYLYRSPLTAKAWKRIHFDLHRDPHDLKVLFGALYTTLPTIALATMPVGYLIGGAPGLWAAFATGLITTCFYEFNHCIQHLNYTPKWKFIQTIKRLHLRHHFHDENTNFGITNFMPDRLFGTFKPSAKGRPQSETVFNLGYTGEEVRRYPWVARATGDIDENRAITEGIERRKPQDIEGAA